MRLLLVVLVIACVSATARGVRAAPAASSADALRLPGGDPLVGVYYFTHWWEPWKSSDERILQDLRRLKSLGINTIFLDSEWSQMIDGNWKLLDRGHRLARQAGVAILPWLSVKVWVDMGSGDRPKVVRDMYGLDLELGVADDGKPGAPKPYGPAVIEAGTRYSADYVRRYLNDGALLRVMWDGKPRPVVALSVELAWAGSCDALTAQMFRLWLRGRFGNDIGRLNRAWKTSLAGFEQVDPCDRKLFDLDAHAAGRAAHPAAVEDHVEFRAQVQDNALAEMKRRLLKEFPDLLIATELPYQLNSVHPHAIGYRVSYGANPSAARHADILVIRATDSLTPGEEKALKDYQKATGQKVILTYRTYPEWGRMLLKGERARGQMVDLYAKQAAKLADGFGFYSWNEMVDTHIVPDPDPPFHPTSRITSQDSEALIGCIGEMVKTFRAAKGIQSR